MIEQPAANGEPSVYQRLVDNLPDLVFVLNQDGHFLSAHGDTASVLEYTPEELCRMNFLDISFLPPGENLAKPEQHSFLNQFSDPTCGSKTVGEYQMTAKSRSGDTRFLELNGTGVYNHEGQITSIYIVARDITYRKRLQARVEYLRQLNEQILGSMLEGLVVLELPDMRVLAANPRFLAAARLQEVQVIGNTCQEIYHRHGRPKLFSDMPQLLKRTLATGKASLKEYSASDLSRYPIDLELTFQPIEGGNGDNRQILLLIRDITRRKRFENDMRRRVQRLSSLSEVGEALQSTIQQLEDVLHAVLVGVTAGKGLGFNRAFILLIDESRNLLQGRMGIGPSDPEEANHIWTSLERSKLKFSELLISHRTAPPDENSKLMQIKRSLSFPLSAADHLLVRSLTENRVFHVVDGKVRGSPAMDVDPGLMRILGVDTFVVIPLYTAQKPIGVLIADNFVTRREVFYEDLEYLKILTHQAGYAIDNARLYQELEQKVGELEQANRSLQEKQLALIEAERLSTIGKMAASVAHEIRNPLVTIGGYARLLLKDLAPDDTRWDDLNVIASEVSRLEFIVNEVLGYARYAKPQMAPGDLSSLVSKVLQTFNTDWTFDNVCVDAVLDTQLPMVNMDANQIKQVLINVLLNAAQAMPKGGRILVTTKLKDQDLELLVADTGHGIPEHLWDKVFAPFFTTKTSGAGLGLNIASQIIAAHGGNIQFESAPGKGTTFRITLPRAKENGSS